MVKPNGTLMLLEHVRPNGLLGPVFDLLNWITVPLFDDHFNRRTAEAAEAGDLVVVSVPLHAYATTLLEAVDELAAPHKPMTLKELIELPKDDEE